MILRRTVIQSGLWAVLSPWQAWLDRRRAALVVGINSYGGSLPPLQGALLDVSLQDHVLQRWGWSQRLILANLQATQGAFLQALETVAAQDMSFLHFSGYVDPEGLWLVDGRCPWSALSGIRIVVVDGRPLPGSDETWHPSLNGSARTWRIVGYHAEHHQRGSLTPDLSVALWFGDPQGVFPHSYQTGSLALPQSPPASGIVVSGGHLWLGGIPQGALAYLLPGTRFRLLKGEQGGTEDLTLMERQGWHGKVQPLSTPAALVEGSLVLERERVLPSKITLKVGWGSRLERVERVDLTNALAGQTWLDLGASDRDCTWEHLEGKGYGLLDRFGDPWWGTFAGEEESLTQGVQRLLPYLRAVHAWKKLSTLLNPAHPHFSLQISTSSETLTLEVTMPPDWLGIALNWDPQARLTLLTPALTAHTRLQFPLLSEPGIHELICLAAPAQPAVVAVMEQVLKNPEKAGGSGPGDWLVRLQDCLSEPGRDPETRRWLWDTVAVQSRCYRVRA